MKKSSTFKNIPQLLCALPFVSHVHYKPVTLYEVELIVFSWYACGAEQLTGICKVLHENLPMQTKTVGDYTVAVGVNGVEERHTFSVRNLTLNWT